jgi:natural product biosynthesis luciferase-like monooxygenase protein
MDFSLFYFANDDGPPGPVKYRLVLEGARFADANGLRAVWTPERHFHPFGGQYPNPAVIGAVIASATQRIQVRAGSVVLPLHHPIRVAEEWAVVDNLSGGRAAISFASGWAVNDFVLAAHQYRDRHAAMYRGIEMVRLLWRGDTVWLPNGHGTSTPVRVRPRPVQPELPFWVTAAGSVRTFQRAGEMGGNVLTHLLGQRLDALRDKIAAYRRARQRAGHASAGCVSLMIHTFVNDDADYVDRIARPALSHYIRSSINLADDNAAGAPAASGTDDVIEFATDKYMSLAGLCGPLDGCAARVRQLADIGVDELACLIDFGIDADAVLGSLPNIRRLADLAGAA